MTALFLFIKQSINRKLRTHIDVNHFYKNIKPFVYQELASAKQAIIQGDAGAGLTHLVNSHVFRQAPTLLHKGA
jgi:hypothetical protein